ncbi:uncharacterized protein M421DRAFT_418480 [Didymella exigua CBS 183.55]|uniref:Uncharacterized protein n=1 Tax=Didymella exigua CBS 183.55 TaxID=1150837 RepID=A0A6A5RUE2_9PLEO|nr:uncharacterized protein M421DRAFT_418480 [Didymella exigua CBS 183.55]KAF1930990.1 hypothetical protein M421DRAFT_418480 [Didymella exigua CBS 183.55]
MQQKLKSVFRKSSKLRSSSRSDEHLGNESQHGEASPSRADRQPVFSDKHDRTSADSSAIGSIYTGRSRPVSSIYDDQRQNQLPVRQSAASASADHNGGAIANDYKAYLPALLPVNDDHGDEYITLSGDRRHMKGESEARHEEDVADRNIARYSTSIDGGHRSTVGVAHNGSAVSSSTAPVSNLPSAQVHSRKQSGATLSSVSTGGYAGKHTLGDNITANGGLIDGIRPHAESSAYEKGFAKKSSFPPKAARAEPGCEKRKPNMSDSDNDTSRAPQETYEVAGSHSGVHHIIMDGTADSEETALARKLREDGVVDLRDTIDTDGDITWAPAVTHEVIKPHQHEVVQHKIYREIHNYEHFHRIQPVMMTEVLPPRHWIPNPNGEGLIEISADELPARTGDNRWWSICEHSSPHSRRTTLPKYRREPEIIEAGTFMTEQGFERKETIIIHPPTLADLTGYGGPVQAMHFDHKTGKSWMGELTTMDRLHELQQELDRALDAQGFEMGGLHKALPKLSSHSACRGSTSMPLRRPVSGHSTLDVQASRTSN